MPGYPSFQPRNFTGIDESLYSGMLEQVDHDGLSEHNSYLVYFDRERQFIQGDEFCQSRGCADWRKEYYVDSGGTYCTRTSGVNVSISNQDGRIRIQF